MSGDLERAALAYARRGLRVHPCTPGAKLPLLKDWPNRATIDSATIASWWRSRQDANVAIATGGEARLLVVDVDPDAGGEVSFAQLEQEHGPLPATAEVVTPRGGRHLYLIVPNGRPLPGNSAGKLGAGIDTRGAGGYVLAPPSEVGGRPYEWSVDSADRLAAAPEWLLARLNQGGGNGHATAPEEWQAIALQGVDAGVRNQTVARVAGLLFRRLPDPILGRRAGRLLQPNQVPTASRCCRGEADARQHRRKGNAAEEAIMSVENFSEALHKRRSETPPPPNASDGGREEIKLQEVQFNAIVRQCAGLLCDRVYLRGFGPFAVVRAAEAAGGRQIEDDDGAAVEIAGVRHRPGALVFTAAGPERVAFWLDERILFKKFSWPAQSWLDATCPPKLALRIIGVASELSFRPCAGIARTPLFVKGEVITSAGWNPATGMILDPPDDLPPIPDAPTRQKAKRALAALLRPFRGYLDDNPNLRPLFAAAALTAALRASLPTAPAIVLDGNTIGAGKGKAARAIAVIGTGNLPAVTAEGHNDEETEKRISAAILQGAPAILLDNLQRPLASTTLESILTDPVARIRKFGSLSDDVVTECRALVLITANNATLRRDLLRRTMPVRLVVPSDKPELRRFDFDPVAEARRDRPQLLAAAFTIAKAWHRKWGNPDHARIREKTLGSFEEWAALVAGAVEWLTGINPIDAIQERKDTDTADAAVRGIIAQLAETFPDSFLAAEAAAQLSAEAWAAVLSFKGEKPTARAVGIWLRGRRDQRFTVLTAEGKPQLVTLQNTGTDRKGNAQWEIKAQEAPSILGSKNPGNPPRSGHSAEYAEYDPPPATRTYRPNPERVKHTRQHSAYSAPDGCPEPGPEGDWDIEL